MSRDRGRSWRDAALGGLVRPAGDAGLALSVTFSPDFARDHTIVASTGSGLFASTDLGATFTPLDALASDATTPGNPAPFVGTPPVLPVGAAPEPSAQLAYASSRAPAVIDLAARSRRPALGVPGLGAQVFVVRSGDSAPADVLAFVTEPDGVGQRLAAYTCDAALTCATRAFAFPAGVELAPGNWVAAAPDGSVVAFLSHPAGGSAVWRSADGRSFAPWRAADALVAAADAAGGSAARVSVSADPDHRRGWYLRIDKARPPDGWHRGDPPAVQVFRSGDDGTTWRRVGFAPGIGQAGSRGNLPWRSPGPVAWVVAAPGGRLLANGSTEAGATVFCSLDGGRRWTVGCPR